jgi:small-conductance mechanosensitive channel
MMDLNANATDGILAKLLYLAVTLVVTAIAARIVGRVYEKALDKARIPSASLFVNVARALVWLAGVLFVVKPVFNIEPTSFVTAVGIVSVALSLGLQDTISNLIGVLAY